MTSIASAKFHITTMEKQSNPPSKNGQKEAETRDSWHK